MDALGREITKKIAVKPLFHQKSTKKPLFCIHHKNILITKPPALLPPDAASRHAGQADYTSPPPEKRGMPFLHKYAFFHAEAACEKKQAVFKKI